ncbi:amino acid ABC transporter periplasmic protein [Candidatus Magnetomorum sp. HK-1]|nr:amino acid ABC transporter periplasmic protein [Candidatus Magnetomorum sp. HK-1]
MFLKKGVLLLSMFCFFVTSGTGIAEKIVKVATLDGYPPYCFLNENHSIDMAPIPPGSNSKKLQGYSWDILRESLHAMGYSIELKLYPWARAMEQTKKGLVDVLFPAGKTKERENIFYFSQESVDHVNFLVYLRKDSQIAWDGLTSLKGLRIGVMRGWNYGEKWNAFDLVEKYEINRIIQGFKMLEKKRLDGFAGYEINFDYALKKEKIKSLFKKSPPFDSNAEFLVGLKNKRVMQIIKDFDEGKKKIIQNGTFDKIAKQWQ